MADMEILNGPSMTELAIAWAYYLHPDNPHIVTFTVRSENGGRKHREHVAITSLERIKGGPTGIKFRGRVVRFDGDMTQEIEGTFDVGGMRDGRCAHIRSKLMAEIV